MHFPSDPHPFFLKIDLFILLLGQGIVKIIFYLYDRVVECHPKISAVAATKNGIAVSVTESDGIVTTAVVWIIRSFHRNW